MVARGNSDTAETESLSSLSSDDFQNDIPECIRALGKHPSTLPLQLPRLRAVLVPWPHSQLLLSGEKVEHLRAHGLDDVEPALDDEEFWIIETPGSSANAEDTAAFTATQIPPRPNIPQVVGTVIFGHSTQYTNVKDFEKNRENHCIHVNSTNDWNGNEG